MSGAFKVPGRAETPEEKRAIIERLYAAWLRYPELRLGQLLENAHGSALPLFYIEDEALLREVEEFAKGRAPRG